MFVGSYPVFRLFSVRYSVAQIRLTKDRLRSPIGQDSKVKVTLGDKI